MPPGFRLMQSQNKAHLFRPFAEGRPHPMPRPDDPVQLRRNPVIKYPPKRNRKRHFSQVNLSHWILRVDSGLQRRL